MTDRIKIYADYDQDAERPNLYGGVMDLVSFNNRHTSFVHPDNVNEDDVVAALSYYEHGAHKWMVGPSTVPDHGGWDTVDHAGYLVWNEHATEGERNHLEAMPEVERKSLLDSLVAEYTAWANGEVYGYRVVRLTTCDACNAEHETEIDSCWGHIGAGWFADAVREVLDYENIRPVDIESVVGDAEYILTNEGIGS